ncbi:MULTISPECIES: TetR/AcrR family transcriptional regulator [Streptomyces]|uniref:TetR/AcrR family transcriptional regulator n=1 Tax=Streptomyces TaxID=1883 RepID=UPI001E57E790|nr:MULTISPECIES: TetR/AcrR family transcriptional regulator [Streptomyces]UFQ19478.1 TetR/AcrR family transcriptional regulator [Streptomyces huasconensis]WCL89097.1 helix-turn-helix domain containing protein [Streptomyces sp. JCM 35825]
MDHAEAEARLLDAAEELFYARGVQAVGMDQVRAASGVSLKRLYQVFPSKSELVRACLDRRDRRWRARLAAHVEACPVGRERVLAVYDWLYEWFTEPDFRGCAFINAYGELGAVDPAVAAAVRAHKSAFHDYLAGLVAAAGGPERVVAPLVLLAEGAMTAAAISGSPEPARQARLGADQLLAAS